MAEPYNLILKSDFSESEKVLSFVEHISRAEGLCEPLQERVKLALSEAATNAIVHGNREDKSKEVFIQAAVFPNQLIIKVRDEGEGFDPKRVPDPVEHENLLLPGGRGIFLIKEYCDSVSFEDEGRIVTLRFERKVKAR